MAVKFPQADVPRYADGASIRGGADLWDTRAGDVLDNDFFAAAAGPEDVRPKDAEWDWDEITPPDAIPTGYQNADAAVVARPRGPDLDWDWSIVVEDDLAIDQAVAQAAVVQAPAYPDAWDWDEVLQPELVPTGYQQADAAAIVAPSKPADHEWDFASDFGGEDGWNNHYTAYDPPAVYDADWDWNECLFGEWIQLGYQQANAPAAPDPIQPRDAEWDWGEWAPADLVVTGYQNADAAVVGSSARPPETEWDFGADFGGEDGWNNHYTAYDEPRIPDMDWDWDECAYGEWIPTGYINADPAPVVVPPQPADDAWDWFEQIDDEWRAEDYQASFIPPSLVLCVEGAWNWDELCEDDYWECDRSQFTGTLVWPDPSTVTEGVQYGPNGIEYTGTARRGGGGVFMRRR